MVSPSVNNFLCITSLGARDFRTLSAMMVKPANSVMMTFAADPNPGLDARSFQRQRGRVHSDHQLHAAHRAIVSSRSFRGDAAMPGQHNVMAIRRMLPRAAVVMDPGSRSHRGPE